MSFRVLPVPDGLDGQRVDSALARMLGLSRTKAGELCAQGRVVSEGNVLTKSDRLLGGSMLEVDLPQPRSPEPVARRLTIWALSMLMMTWWWSINLPELPPTPLWVGMGLTY